VIIRVPTYHPESPAGRDRGFTQFESIIPFSHLDPETAPTMGMFPAENHISGAKK
jgi:hypothetical protein